MAASALAFAEADDELWHEYDLLARRAYGQPVEDITRLGAHADRRVALRGGKVVAGGLGMLIPQWFGGRPVPSASMACGCVAPEERGGQLAARLTVERLQPLREQGAVLATLWTASTGYVRRMGWEAPAPVYSWTVPTDELRRRFDESDVEIQHGETAQLPPLRDTLAARWNGTWQRPAWWVDWQQAQHPGLSTYRFGPPGEEPTGVLSVAGERHPVEGRRLVVHDFWAADYSTASAMFAFLGRHNSRIPTVAFQRTGLPPGPLLLHQLHRSGGAVLAPMDGAGPGPAPRGGATRLAGGCRPRAPARRRVRERPGGRALHPADRRGPRGVDARRRRCPPSRSCPPPPPRR